MVRTEITEHEVEKKQQTLEKLGYKRTHGCLHYADSGNAVLTIYMQHKKESALIIQGSNGKARLIKNRNKISQLRNKYCFRDLSPWE